jgi:hypothetical protein
MVAHAEEAADLLVPNPPDSRSPRLRTAWYLYEGRLLPGLIGYIIYHVDETAQASSSHIETLSHLLSHAAVMGAGSSRAAGFGHVEIHPYERRRSGEAGRGHGGEPAEEENPVET